MKNLLAYGGLAEALIHEITTETISAYVGTRQRRGLQVSRINRELQVLRRMFHPAQE